MAALPVAEQFLKMQELVRLALTPWQLPAVDELLQKVQSSKMCAPETASVVPRRNMPALDELLELLLKSQFFIVQQVHERSSIPATQVDD
jgi:hypothetical protein